MAAAAGPMSTGEANRLPPDRPLWTATTGTPVSRAACRNGRADGRRGRVVVVEVPTARRVGVHLPRAQLVGRGDIGHRRQGDVERPDVGHGVSLDQDAVVAAELGRQRPAPLHRVDRQRVGGADDGDRRDDGDGGVAAGQHQVAPVLRREAVDRVGLPTCPLREVPAPRRRTRGSGSARRRRSRPAGASVGVRRRRRGRVGSPWIVVVASSGSVAAVSGTVNVPPGRVPSDCDFSSLHAWRAARPEAIPADDKQEPSS